MEKVFLWLNFKICMRNVSSPTLSTVTRWKFLQCFVFTFSTTRTCITQSKQVLLESHESKGEQSKI